MSQQAAKLFNAGQYRESIELFGQSNDIVVHRSNWYFIGEAYRRLGERRQSYRAYWAYAALLPPQERAAFMPKLETLRSESPCTVSIITDPGGATVAVDGQARGKTPVDGRPAVLSVPGGKHQVAIRLAGHRDILDEIDAAFGEPIALKYALVGTISTGVTPPPNPATTPRNQPQAKAPLATATDATRASASRQSRPVSQPTARRGRSAPGLGTGGFVEASSGLAIWQINGHALEARTGVAVNAGGGFFWNLGPVDVQMSGAVDYAPLPDSAAEHAALVSFLAGVGVRWRFLSRVTLRAQMALGTALLVGADEHSAFFSGASAVSGAFALFALRPAIDLDFRVWRGLFVTVNPLAITYCPRHHEFNPEIGAVTRLQFGVGIGWQL